MPKENLKRTDILQKAKLGDAISNRNKNSYKKSYKEDFSADLNNLKNRYPSKNTKKKEESIPKKINKTETQKPIPARTETPPEIKEEIKTTKPNETAETEEEIVNAIIEPRTTEEKVFVTPKPAEKNSEDVFGLGAETPDNLQTELEIEEPEPAQEIPQEEPSQEDDVEKRLASVKKRLAEIEELKEKNQIEKRKNEFHVGQVVKIKRSPGSGGQIEEGWLVSGFTEDGKVIVRGKTIAKEGGINEYQQRTVTQETLIEWQKLNAEIDIRETKEEIDIQKANNILESAEAIKRTSENLGQTIKETLARLEKIKKEESIKATLETERLSRDKSVLDKKILLLNTEYQKLQKRSDSWWSKITFGFFVDEEKMIKLSDEIATLESRRNMLKETIEKISRLLN